MATPPPGHLARDRSNDSLDDAEKGMHDSTYELAPPPSFVYLGSREVDPDATS